jgi:seryl-tRNA synthetase
MLWQGFENPLSNGHNYLGGTMGRQERRAARKQVKQKVARTAATQLGKESANLREQILAIRHDLDITIKAHNALVVALKPILEKEIPHAPDSQPAIATPDNSNTNPEDSGKIEVQPETPRPDENSD